MFGAFALRSSEAPFIYIALACRLNVLGRAAGCDLVIDHRSISRKHAEIRADELGLVVTDLGSRNGTFLQGRPIRQERAAPGQIVRFGSVSFSVELVDPAPTSDEDTGGSADVGEVLGTFATAANLLSEAQKRVFNLLVSGHAEKNIARRLDLSRHTIHNHVTAIYRAYKVHARSELLALFVQNGANGLRR